MLYLGCHLSATDGYAAMGRTAVGIGANTFAFFTRNPRGSRAKAEVVIQIPVMQIVTGAAAVLGIVADLIAVVAGFFRFAQQVLGHLAQRFLAFTY